MSHPNPQPPSAPRPATPGRAAEPDATQGAPQLYAAALPALGLAALPTDAPAPAEAGLALGPRLKELLLAQPIDPRAATAEPITDAAVLAELEQLLDDSALGAAHGSFMLDPYSGFRVTGAVRVRAGPLWRAFHHHCPEEGDPTPTALLHGTAGACVAHICRAGLRASPSGTFGPGLYLAENSSVAHLFATGKGRPHAIILCLAHLGRTARTAPGRFAEAPQLRSPPRGDDGGAELWLGGPEQRTTLEGIPGRCDTLVASHAYKEYVLRDPLRAYPAVVIHYEPVPLVPDYSVFGAPAPYAFPYAGGTREHLFSGYSFLDAICRTELHAGFETLAELDYANHFEQPQGPFTASGEAYHLPGGVQHFPLRAQPAAGELARLCTAFVGLPVPALVRALRDPKALRTEAPPCLSPSAAHALHPAFAVPVRFKDQFGDLRYVQVGLEVAVAPAAFRKRLPTVPWNSVAEQKDPHIPNPGLEWVVHPSPPQAQLCVRAVVVRVTSTSPVEDALAELHPSLRAELRRLPHPFRTPPPPPLHRRNILGPDPLTAFPGPGSGPELRTRYPGQAAARGAALGNGPRAALRAAGHPPAEDLVRLCAGFVDANQQRLAPALAERLTRDEQLALAALTARLDGDEAVPDLVNTLFRAWFRAPAIARPPWQHDNDAAEQEPDSSGPEGWRDFAFYLYAAVEKLEPFAGTAFRVAAAAPGELAAGDRTHYAGFTGAALAREGALAGLPEGGEGVVHVCAVHTARLLAPYSCHPEELAVLLLPGTAFEVSAVLSANAAGFLGAPGLTVVDLAEAADSPHLYQPQHQWPRQYNLPRRPPPLAD